MPRRRGSRVANDLPPELPVHARRSRARSEATATTGTRSCTRGAAERGAKRPRGVRLRAAPPRGARGAKPLVETEGVCKPDSVPGRNGPGDGHSSGRTIARGLDAVGPGFDGRATLPQFDLAPDGVCRAPRLSRAAGGLLPHLFTLTAHAEALTAVWFSVALSPDCAGPRLAAVLPCGVRTFLPGRSPIDRPTPSVHRFVAGARAARRAQPSAVVASLACSGR